MRLLLIGFGAVGQGLATILRDQAAYLLERSGFEAHIVGVVTRTRGLLYQPDGLSIDALLEAIGKGHLDLYPTERGLIRQMDPLDLIRTAAADALVEVSYSNLQTAQPALDYCRAALESGKHVVMANKGPAALAYAELQALGQQVGKFVGIEATVMAGTPTLRLALEALAGCRILAARGILNGTTNYILTQMESGMAYGEALEEAQALGYAEADPTADVEGWDAAGKAVILAAAVFQQHLSLETMPVKGISHLTRVDLEEAQAAGECWKLIATVTPDGGQVEPVRLPLSHPLARVSGATNAVTFSTDLLGDVTLVGPGAGPIATGFGLLADLFTAQRAGQLKKS
ncbi:MAG: homoserine dehydrogenase [Anaerolineae bacterium]|nr:homoserine dehydrogenase [Anaerolineae bacterium]